MLQFIRIVNKKMCVIFDLIAMTTFLQHSDLKHKKTKRIQNYKIK
jgi:hypothetical protein